MHLDPSGEMMNLQYSHFDCKVFCYISIKNGATDAVSRYLLFHLFLPQGSIMDPFSPDHLFYTAIM